MIKNMKGKRENADKLIFSLYFYKMSSSRINETQDHLVNIGSVTS